MNEFQEIEEWYQKADAILCSLTADKIENILMVAAFLRQIHVEAKATGVREWNNTPR